MNFTNGEIHITEGTAVFHRPFSKFQWDVVFLSLLLSNLVFYRKQKLKDQRLSF